MAQPDISKELAKELEVILQQVKTSVKTANQVVSLETQARLKRLNPKATNWSANNWNLAIGQPDRELRPPQRPKKKIKLTGPNIGAIGKITDKSVIYITNNTPYVIYLEEGHSKQQAAGWFRRTAKQAYDRYNKVLIENLRNRVKGIKG